MLSGFYDVYMHVYNVVFDIIENSCLRDVNIVWRIKSVI